LKRVKVALTIFFGLLLAVVVMLAIIRSFLIHGYPLVAGGYESSPKRSFTAKALAIVERPFFGNDRRYYRFELLKGGPDGPILKSVTMEPIAGEEFRMPRSSLAFPIQWSDDSHSVIFAAQGVELILHNPEIMPKGNP
jgi:hypothetical protein